MATTCCESPEAKKTWSRDLNAVVTRCASCGVGLDYKPNVNEEEARVSGLLLDRVNGAGGEVEHATCPVPGPEGEGWVACTTGEGMAHFCKNSKWELGPAESSCPCQCHGWRNGRKNEVPTRRW